MKQFKYPDHFKYSKEDILKIKTQAKLLKANVITTEKDYFRISNIDRKDIKFLKVGLKFKDENKLIDFIKSKIND